MKERELVAMEKIKKYTTAVRFELTRGNPIGLAGQRLNHSAKLSFSGVLAIYVLFNCSAFEFLIATTELR